MRGLGARFSVFSQRRRHPLQPPSTICALRPFTVLIRIAPHCSKEIDFFLPPLDYFFFLVVAALAFASLPLLLPPSHIVLLPPPCKPFIFSSLASPLLFIFFPPSSRAVSAALDFPHINLATTSSNCLSTILI